MLGNSIQAVCNYRKWRLVTHPDSVSPFPDAAFINFTCQMSLAEVTHGNVTFAEFRGELQGLCLVDGPLQDKQMKYLINSLDELH